MARNDREQIRNFLLSGPRPYHVEEIMVSEIDDFLRALGLEPLSPASTPAA